MRTRGRGRYLDTAAPVVMENPFNRDLVSWLLPVRPSWGSQRMLDLLQLGTGTLNGGAFWTPNPYGGLAIGLDGTDDYIDCGAPTVFDVAGANGSFSIALWLRFSNTVLNAGLSQKGSGVNSRPWQFFWDQTVSTRFQMYDGVNNPLADTTTVINDGAWHLVIGVRDCVNSVMRVYVDGDDQTTNASNVAFTTGFNDAGIVTIGDNRNGLLSFLAGTIGAHWVFKRALQPYDAAYLYSQVLTGYPDLLRYRGVVSPGITEAASHRFNAAYARQASRIVTVGCF